MDCICDVEAVFSLDDSSTGVLYHNELLERDSHDQHPVSAITGLVDALESLSEANRQLESKVKDINVPTKTSELENDSGFISSKVQDTQELAGALQVQNQIDILGDDGHSLQISPHQITSNDTLSIYGDVHVNNPIITSDTTSYASASSNQLVRKQQVEQAIANLSVGGDVDLSEYALKSEVPTKTSQLTNDSGFITEIPAEYVTEDELSAKGYLTEHQSLEGLATKDELESKADNATTLAGYGITNAYTKSEVDAKVASVYRFRGSVANYGALPASGMVEGDVYNVEDTGANYAWTGMLWDKLSETVDLTGYALKSYVDDLVALKADSSTVAGIRSELDLASDDIVVLEADVAVLRKDVSDLKAGSGTASSSAEKYGIQADYSLHYGILDCPRGLIEYSINNKEIKIQSGVVLKAAGADMKTTIASATTYEVEETGDVTLFFTRTESSSGTIQVGFLEAGDVYYQEEEPDNGITSFLAWWQPSKKLWQFKSAYTGNVWRTAVATPIANIKAGATGITNIDYIGYRIIDDDIFVQQSEIDSIQETISTINTNVSTLDTQVDGLYTQVSENMTKLNTCVTSTEITRMVKMTQADYDALETKDPKTFYIIVE